MRAFLLAAVIVSLTTAVTRAYNFGDILSFPRGDQKCPYLIHYGVYVGDHNEVKGRTSYDQDIFHNDGTSCVFAKVADVKKQHCLIFKDSKVAVDHHYEQKDPTTYKKSDDAEIIKRINGLRNDCGPYKLLANNCEHLSTYVRYGIGITEQKGSKIARIVCKGNRYQFYDESKMNALTDEDKAIINLDTPAGCSMDTCPSA